MSRKYDIRVSIREVATGIEVFGEPLTTRLTADEDSGPAFYEQATGGGYISIPSSFLDEIQLLCIKADKAVTVRLNAQSDAGIDLNAGGFILVVNGDLDSGPTTNATVDNSSGATATLETFAAGT